ncbi:MAG: hypothetical protein ABL901_02865 [Hyphomicrobiaceae bacterium]|nr:hypothetical protein [Hyphomicrobiaceae bacterium]
MKFPKKLTDEFLWNGGAEPNQKYAMSIQVKDGCDDDFYIVQDCLYKLAEKFYGEGNMNFGEITGNPILGASISKAEDSRGGPLDVHTIVIWGSHEFIQKAWKKVEKSCVWQANVEV